MVRVKSVNDISAELFVMAAIGLVLGLIGPMGSFAQPLGARLAGWLAMALLGYAFFRPVIAAGTALSEQTGLPYWVALVMACAIAAVPTSVLVCWLDAGFRFGRIDSATMTRVYPYVFLMGGIATTIQVMLFRPRATTAAIIEALAPPEPAEPLTPTRVPFLDRLPPALGGDLLCLEMEDHYVRAHTAGGSTLILMRLRDAIAELDGLEGARVHRSWWVARAAVAEVLRKDRATQLKLVNGLEVPVARNELPALRANGWL